MLEKRLRRIVSVDEMQFGFMLERGAIDAVFIMRRLHEEYHVTGRKRGTIDAVFIMRRLHEEYHVTGRKLYMCFFDLEKTFDREPRKVLEWAIEEERNT